MMLTKDDAILALKKVRDPELELDVWTLGLIYGISIENDNIHLKMTFTSPTCPYAPQLVEEIKARIIESGFMPPVMEYVFDPPWEPSEEVRMLLGLA